MECAMTIQCANVVVDIVSCILDKLCRQVRNVSSVWVSSISLKLVHLFAVADLGGGGSEPPLSSGIKKKNINSYCRLALTKIFFLQKEVQYAHAHKLKPPLHKKSRSAPALCMNSRTRTHMHDDEASR